MELALQLLAAKASGTKKSTGETRKPAQRKKRVDSKGQRRRGIFNAELQRTGVVQRKPPAPQKLLLLGLIQLLSCLHAKISRIRAVPQAGQPSCTLAGSRAPPDRMVLGVAV